MNRLERLGLAAAIVAASWAAPQAWAAAPAGDDTRTAPVPMAAIAPLKNYDLDTEMVVHDWVLCVSQDVAEKLAHAGEQGMAEARATYVDLAGSRRCGQFKELLVVLRKRVYASPAGSSHGARVFEVRVKLADNWASAFVVTSGLPDR